MRAKEQIEWCRTTPALNPAQGDRRAYGSDRQRGATKRGRLEGKVGTVQHALRY
jgi:hypothetical protein